MAEFLNDRHRESHALFERAIAEFDEWLDTQWRESGAEGPNPSLHENDDLRRALEWYDAVVLDSAGRECGDRGAGPRVAGLEADLRHCREEIGELREQIGRAFAMLGWAGAMLGAIKEGFGKIAGELSGDAPGTEGEEGGRADDGVAGSVGEEGAQATQAGELSGQAETADGACSRQECAGVSGAWEWETLARGGYGK